MEALARSASNVLRSRTKFAIFRSASAMASLLWASATGMLCEYILPYISPRPVFRFGRRHTHRAIRAGNHVGEGGLWHLGDALRSRRVDLDGGGRARGAVAGRRQPPSASRRRFAKTGGVIGCCSQAAADKDMNNIPAQAVARAAAGGAISTHSRHRCTCVLPLPPNSAPLSSTRAHPIICSQADCGVCCAMPTHQTLARA